MNPYLIAFITGLTTGGLSCLAVQGGLLATALSPQTAAPKAIKAAPILLFLAAKLVAYTLLGLLLGALGSMLQLTAFMRAVLYIGIGIFMVGNGLRMLNVHPIFRYFVFEPPAAVTRYLRRKAKVAGASHADAVTPLTLGALTVLIPCGVTQAMMALALGTGNALQAAGLMAAFTFGSSIIFFVAAYLATRLGSLLERNFARVVAVVLLVLGLVSVDSGLNLMGSPLSFARLTQAAAPVVGIPVEAVSRAPSTSCCEHDEVDLLIDPTAEAVEQASTENRLQIDVLNTGYAPRRLSARADIPTEITFVTDNVFSCSLALVIPELRIEQMLPTTGAVTLEIPPQPAGKVLRYSCSMGMYTGEIVFDQ